jgi:hypothetical protein
MADSVSLADARAILSDDLLGPEEIRRAFGEPMPPTPPIPFSRNVLERAPAEGEMLVLRLDRFAAEAPLTPLALIERVPRAFDQARLRQMGYQLKEEWGITLEPLARTATCMTGWALVRKVILAESRNLSFEEQEEVLRACADARGLRAPVRRRTGVEAMYDTILAYEARGERLLERSWDWCSTRTLDGGFLNVGGFGAAGLQILSYSPGVRHGALGVCPTCQPGT